MHTLEPHFNWRHLYVANQDPRSPFYGYENSEVFFTDTIYDHIIHPQWVPNSLKHNSQINDGGARFKRN